MIGPAAASDFGLRQRCGLVQLSHTDQDQAAAPFPSTFSTALSTLFGAPFWFDLLQNFIRLKGTGPSPVEKVDGKGAAA